MKIDTEFLEQLASPKPMPGGGGACAYAAALGAALAQMVGNLTVNKPDFEQDRARVALEKLAVHRERLISLIGEDTRAYMPLARAYKMPHETDAQREVRNHRIQVTLIPACETPLRIMEECKAVIELCDELAKIGPHMTLPDAGAGALLAEAALHGASLDVYINAHALTDRDRAQKYTDKADALAADIKGKAQAVYDSVLKEVR